MAGQSLAQKLNSILEKIYTYQGTPTRPNFSSGTIWAMPEIAIKVPWATNMPEGALKPGEQYFLHYYQNQGYGPTLNECVTTSAITIMNILKDWVAIRQGQSIEADKLLPDYTKKLDERGIWGWRYRFSTNSWLPGMMTPWQAIIALKDHATHLKEVYGKSYKIKLSVEHTVDDLIQLMREGKIMLLHGAWQKVLTNLPDKDRYLAYLGGTPHTMVLIGYEGEDDRWILLNPAHPWPVDKTKPPVKPVLYHMTTKGLLEFWGRQFLFYPTRFAITIITPEM